MRFLCACKPVFLTDFTECDKCGNKDKCLNYIYEVGFQEKKEKLKSKKEGEDL